MNTEKMHNALVQGEHSQQEFFEQMKLLLTSKVYLEGIIIDGRESVFQNLRAYVTDPEGLNLSVAVLSAMLLPASEIRVVFLAILAEETIKEAEQDGVTRRQINRKYKSSKEEKIAQVDFLEHPEIHGASLAGITLTNSQKNKIRKQNSPPTQEMTTIRYAKGNLEDAIRMLSKKHTQSEMQKLPEIIEPFI